MHKKFQLILSALLCASPLAAQTQPKYHEITQELKALRSSEYRLNKTINPGAKKLLDKIDDERYIAKDESFWGRLKKRVTLIFPLGFIRNMVDLVLLKEEQAPRTHRLIKEVAEKLNLPMPMVFVAKDKNLFNAFASGFLQSMSVVVLGEELVEATSMEELEFLIAHELSHIKKRHVLKKITLGITAFAATYIGFNYLLQYFEANINTQERFYNLFKIVVLMRLSESTLQPLTSYYSRVCEKDADITAAKAVGVHGGIALMQKLKTKEPDIDADFNYVEKEIQDSPLKNNDQFKGEAAIGRVIEKIKDAIFRTHPMSETRIQYLEEFEKNQAAA